MASELDVSARAARLDRELVIAHLQDLLGLHVAQDALSEQVTSCDTRFKQLKWELDNNFIFGKPPQEPHQPPLKVVQKAVGTGKNFVLSCGLGCGGSLVAFFIVMVVGSIVAVSSMWRDATAVVIMLVVAIGVPLSDVLTTVSSHRRESSIVERDNEKAQEEYSRQQAAYAEDLKQWEQGKSARMARMAKECAELAEQIKTGKRELDRVNATLDSAYAINIIPAPFRSTEAIYYLVSYLSTSRETMSSALLHANLEDIKRRLNQVILNQRKQMVQQAIDSARLANLSDAVGQTTNQVVRLGDRMGELIGEATALRTSSEKAARHMENIEHYAQIGASHLASTRYWQQTMALDNYAHR